MNYPDLKDQSIISLDIETYDPKLGKRKGPGVYRKDGYILGVSITTPNGFSEYFNIGHDGIDHDTKRKNLSYLKEQLAHDNKKLGANIFYDLDWLENGYNIKVNGEYHDIQYAEPLIDEYARSYSLDNLSKKYLGVGKVKGEIEQFAEDNNWKGDARAHLYKMPFEMVRKYALGDTQLPLQIFKKQWDILKEQGLLNVYHMETGLMPLLLQMRRNGVRVDQDKARMNESLFTQKIELMERVLYDTYGKFNFNSTKQMATVFDRLGIKYGYTEKGNPSINAAFLKSMIEQYPICKNIVDIKKLSRFVSATIQNVLLDPDFCVDGRIHALFHPLRSDGMGTVSGRFSSSNPNLQQVPSKGENFGNEAREMFIPEKNQLWAKLDYSQIEYRILAHYAQGKRAEELRHKYNSDPSTDYHQTVMNWTGLDRKYAKNLNFGTMYAMGVKTCAELFGWTKDYAKETIDLYHSEMPYIKTTMNGVIQMSKARKYIKTILKRRARVSPEMEHGGKHYIMFNRLIQGSAADIMKKGMFDAYKKGVFDTLTPHITVHDEIDCSVPKNKEGVEALRELKNCMENCVELEIPIKVDVEIGDNWGNVTEKRAEEFLK